MIDSDSSAQPLAFPAECLRIFRKEKARNGIVVVLPSVGNRVIPYFNRMKWQSDFKDICFIACADPALLSRPSIRGGWFLHPEYGSYLPALATLLKEFINEHAPSRPPIIFAGSSMGGYAALVMATLMTEAFAFAECPQIMLKYHAGGARAVASAFGARVPAKFLRYVNICRMMQEERRIPNGKVFIPISDRLHVSRHVSRFVAKASRLACFGVRPDYFTVQHEGGQDGPTGHAPLPRERFKAEVEALFVAARKYGRSGLEASA